MAMGVSAQGRGEAGRQEALAAFREVRRALISTRSWWVPHPEILADANEHIATLMAEQEEVFGTDTSGTGDAYNHHLRLLSKLPGPDPPRGNPAALAFIAWLACSVGFVWRGLDAEGGLASKPAVRWGAAWLVTLGAWTLLLRWAS